MTLQEAQNTCRKGIKITHYYFSVHEFVYCDKDGSLRDEKGYKLGWFEFWNIRKTNGFEKDWYLYNETEN
jgi:hypothetical protein